MSGFCEKEYYDLCSKYNMDAYIKDITLRYTRKSFFNKMKESVQSDRRGEVVFCVVRPSGKVIAITCEEYPKGIFRIPSGGIGHSEGVEEAVLREAKEELGIDAAIDSFVGVIRIEFMYEKESFFFYSYIFTLKELGGKLVEDASDEEISEVLEIGIEELEKIVMSLYSIEGRWKDWGKFRYITSKAVLDFFKNKAESDKTE